MASNETTASDISLNEKYLDGTDGLLRTSMISSLVVLSGNKPWQSPPYIKTLNVDDSDSEFIYISTERYYIIFSS